MEYIILLFVLSYAMYASVVLDTNKESESIIIVCSWILVITYIVFLIMG